MKDPTYLFIDRYTMCPSKQCVWSYTITNLAVWLDESCIVQSYYYTKYIRFIHIFYSFYSKVHINLLLISFQIDGGECEAEKNDNVTGATSTSNENGDHATTSNENGGPNEAVNEESDKVSTNFSFND